MENTVEMSEDEFEEGKEIKQEPDDEVICRKKIKKPRIFTAEELEKQDIVRINILKKQNKISTKCVKGVQIPAAISSFEELFSKYNISAQLIENVKEIGYDTPTPIQMQSLPILLSNLSLKACAETGSGKTCAFLLPMVQNIIRDNETSSTNAIKGLIICPTRELASQILRECVRICDKTDVRAHIITKTDDESMKKFHKKKTNILIVTPNRLSFFLKQNLPNFNLDS